MKDKIFAIYRGDKFIDVGTIKELSKRLNVKEDTIKFYGTPTYLKNRANENRLILIELDEDD